ncbi:transglutaminase family protein [Marivivens aquimaris]|uniref:transglutaminase family protein n=1 Tax=Marivivens aquimaris TaxID=2774876 RepID=UPI0018825447|nr:transglutaminase family protein [Marivivens aquimaris]
MTQKLHIIHRTTYSYDEPVPFGLQQLRVTPKGTRNQTVLEWDIQVEGGKVELSYEDHHQNHVTLVSFEPNTTQVTLVSQGVVEIVDTHGVYGPHSGNAPCWLFENQTPLTKPGAGCRSILSKTDGEVGTLDWLHALSAAILESVAYETGRSDAMTTAEDAISAGHGVCQDHTHIFLACCRHAGVPARYVSGYLLMDDRIEQEATHAWAEALVPSLGWVGFDISNGISPDTRYVRVATGLDYNDAAPISGTRFGGASEELIVELQVQQ